MDRHNNDDSFREKLMKMTKCMSLSVLNAKDGFLDDTIEVSESALGLCDSRFEEFRGMLHKLRDELLRARSDRSSKETCGDVELNLDRSTESLWRILQMTGESLKDESAAKAAVSAVDMKLSDIDHEMSDEKTGDEVRNELINIAEVCLRDQLLISLLQEMASLVDDCTALNDAQQSHPDNASVDGMPECGMKCGEDGDEEPCSSRRARHDERIGRLIGILVKNNVFIKQPHIRCLKDCTDRIAETIAALNSKRKHLKNQLADAEKALKKSQKKRLHDEKLLDDQRREYEIACNRIAELNVQLVVQKKVAEEMESGTHQSDGLEERARFLTNELEDVRLKGITEVNCLQAELQLSKEQRKKISVEDNIRKTQLRSLQKDLSERSRELCLLQRKLSEESEACKKRLTMVEERAKNAEVEYLKIKLQAGIANLERAYKDAGQLLQSLESLQKRRGYALHNGQLESAILCWKARCERISELISSARADFAVQIDAVHAGSRLEELPQISVPEPPPLPRLLEFGQTTSEASSLEAGEVFSAEASTSNGMQRTSAIGIPSVVSFDGQCSKSSMDGMNVLDNHSDKPNTIVNDAYFLPAPSSSGISVSSTWDDLLVTKSTVHQSNGSDDCLQASFNGSSDNAVPLKQVLHGYSDFGSEIASASSKLSTVWSNGDDQWANPAATVDSVEIVLGDKGHCESMRQADHLHSLTAFAGLPIDYEMRSGRSLFTGADQSLYG